MFLIKHPVSNEVVAHPTYKNAGYKDVEEAYCFYNVPKPYYFKAKYTVKTNNCIYLNLNIGLPVKIFTA